MKKTHLCMLWMLSALLLVTSVPMRAQIKVEKVKLPFAFRVGETQLDAGTYTFAQETVNDQMQIQGGKKGRLLIRTSPLQSESPFGKDHTTLVFHKSGEKYFLNQVWSKHLGFQMPLSAEEKELVAGGQQISEVKVNVKQ
jgi:hypothetical protein